MRLAATILLAAIVSILLLQNIAWWPASSEASRHITGDQDAGHIENQSWSYSPDLHAEDFTLDEKACGVAFPDLWYEVDRSVVFWQAQLSRHGVVVNTSTGLQKDGTFRALIHNNHLRILQTKGIFGSSEPQLAERAVAVWQQIHRALLGASAAGEVLPSIEFSVSVEDIPLAPHEDDGTYHALWAFSRNRNTKAHEGLFLMPDFNHWSWRGVAGPFSEMRVYSKAADGPLSNKISKLMWRGAVWTNPALRGALVQVTSGKPWADVSDFDWSTRAGHIDTEDFCRFGFLAHTEGRSWSGRLKYLLNCRSVTVIHELEWTAHYYHLLKSEGSEQNFVSVKRDFSDLETSILLLLDGGSAAQKIADNAIATFRDRYLTLAAETCYWRHLIRSWREVTGGPQVLEQTRSNLSGVVRTKEKLRGIAFEELVVFRGEAEWPPVPLDLDAEAEQGRGR